MDAQFIEKMLVSLASMLISMNKAVEEFYPDFRTETQYGELIKSAQYDYRVVVDLSKKGDYQAAATLLVPLTLSIGNAIEEGTSLVELGARRSEITSIACG